MSDTARKILSKAGKFKYPLIVLAVGVLLMTAESGNTITKFPYLQLGRSALTEEGDTVYAIGSPLSQSNTMTSGIISNTCRILTAVLSAAHP